MARTFFLTLLALVSISPTKRSKEGFIVGGLYSVKHFRNLSFSRPGPKRRLNSSYVVQRNHSQKIISKNSYNIAIAALLQLAYWENVLYDLRLVVGDVVAQPPELFPSQRQSRKEAPTLTRTSFPQPPTYDSA